MQRGLFMYSAKTTKQRIKELAKQRKVNMESVLETCELGVNAIRQINDKKGMASFSLAKIADCLECSVDYLLGRSDNVIMSNSSNSNISKQDSELLELFKSLSPETSELITQLLKSVVDKPDTVKNLKEMIQKVS